MACLDHRLFVVVRVTWSLCSPFSCDSVAVSFVFSPPLRELDRRLAPLLFFTLGGKSCAFFFIERSLVNSWPPDSPGGASFFYPTIESLFSLFIRVVVTVRPLFLHGPWRCASFPGGPIALPFISLLTSTPPFLFLLPFFPQSSSPQSSSRSHAPFFSFVGCGCVFSPFF